MTEVSDVRVLSEPRVYSLTSRYSYLRDVMSLSLGLDGDGVSRRLGQYGRELVYEIDQRSREGLRAERVLRAACRVPDSDTHEELYRDTVSELRNLVTGGDSTATAGSGGAAFVTPFFMWDEWAPYRGIPRAFTDQCHLLPLPAYGMQIYLPSFTSATGVGQQVEGSSVAETDPSTALQGSGAVQTISGQITLSQQLSDRGFTGGGTFDAVMGRQLLQQLNQQVDVYVVTQVLGMAPLVTGQATYSTAGLYQDLASAAEKLADIGGARLRPTHIFSTSNLYLYATRQVDSQNRPVLTPQYAPGFPVMTGADDNDSRNVPKWSRFTGTIMPQGSLWFTDDNIPVFGTTNETQIIVASPEDSVLVLEDDPVLGVYPQNVASQLEITMVLRQYTAAIVRHVNGVAAIAGAAYTTSLQ